MIERFRSSQGDISPPAGGEFLSQRWERNQWPRPPSLAPSGQFTLRIAGGRGRRALRAHRTAYPRSPITGVTPLAWRWIFGAQNLSGLLPFNPGHWALGVQKFRTNAVPQPRLALPNQRSRFKTRIPHPPPSGAPSPKGEGRGVGFQKPSPLGEGVTRSVTDEVRGQRPPAGRPLRKDRRVPCIS